MAFCCILGAVLFTCITRNMRTSIDKLGLFMPWIILNISLCTELSKNYELAFSEICQLFELANLSNFFC